MGELFPLPTLDASQLGAHHLFALTDEALFEACGVRIMFASRAGGVSEGAFASLNCSSAVGDAPAAVARNRELVSRALGQVGREPVSLIVPSQVHGTHIVDVKHVCQCEDAAREAEAGADGIVVRCSDVTALLNFADCLSLILVAPAGDFAVIHAGWRGAVAHIAHKAACLLAPAPDQAALLNAYIGPHIHSECFEVDCDVAKRFTAEFGRDVVADEHHVSLLAAVRSDLLRAGVRPQRIVDAGICTSCHSDKYFSFRASGGTCGRNSVAAVRMSG